MRERPILFSGEMVRAILKGQKSVTRRLIKPTPAGWNPAIEVDGVTWAWCLYGDMDYSERIRSPFKTGDWLWVRETWNCINPEGFIARDIPPGSGDGYWTAIYAATDDTDHAARGFSWRPSIHMPRWASRLTLEVLSVRAERLQQITEEDAGREGVKPFQEAYPGIAPEQRLTTGEVAVESPLRSSFAVLWDCLNDHRATWKDNPWVWRIEFQRLEVDHA